MSDRPTAEIVADLRAKAQRWPRVTDGICDDAADRLEQLEADLIAARNEARYYEDQALS